MSKIYESLCLLVLLSIGTHGTAAAAAASKKRVCVIGAGAAGLASLKQLVSNLNDFEPVVYEKNSDVGGLWIYSDNGEFDLHGLPVHSSVYKNLRTNVPKELMAFPDYRNFHGENRSCVHHKTVLEYLRNYTDHFDLRRYIQFETIVEKVSPILNDDNDWQQTKWRVESFNMNTKKSNDTICDAVMVCNGHFFEPIIPKIPGIDSFSGRLIHSHAYRKPEEFTNRTVALLGASFSGVDIASDLSLHARKIYLSHKHNKMKSELPANIEQVRNVVAASGNVLLLRDNRTIVVDAFIYCTGYKYSMPFLDPHNQITVGDKSVFPLYEHIVNIKYPTMGFIGIPDTAFFLPTFNVQAKYFVALLQGKVQLPKPADLLHNALDNVLRKRRKPHVLEGDRQFKYLYDLAEDGHFEPLPKLYEDGFKYWISRVIGKQMSFRNYDLQVGGNGQFKLVDSKTPSGSQSRI